MAFDGSAIRALLDGAVAQGAVHGIAALVVDRKDARWCAAPGEASGSGAACWRRCVRPATRCMR